MFLIQKRDNFITRCPNEIMKGYHCESHFAKANELYKKYKKTCNTAYKLHPEKINTNEVSSIQDSIQYLFKCHVWYVNAYKDRMEHRNYAFTPDTSNYGHNKQFEIIQNKLDICNDKLQELFIKSKDKPKKNSREKKKEIKEEVKIEEIGENEKIKLEIEEFKKKRIDDEKETQKMMELYIKENRKFLDKKYTVRDNCVKAMKKFMKLVTGTDKLHFHYYVGLFRILMVLIPLDFFKPDFEPPRSKCQCCRYLSIDDKLDCKCIQNYNNLNIYLNKHIKHDSYVERLKEIINILTNNCKKLISIYEDFEKIYKYKGVQSLYIELSFKFNENRNNYELIDPSEE